MRRAHTTHEHSAAAAHATVVAVREYSRGRGVAVQGDRPERVRPERTLLRFFLGAFMLGGGLLRSGRIRSDRRP